MRVSDGYFHHHFGDWIVYKHVVPEHIHLMSDAIRCEIVTPSFLAPLLTKPTHKNTASTLGSIARREFNHLSQRAEFSKNLMMFRRTL